MSRVGAGVFRRLLHEVGDDADDMRFDGRHLWWSRCRSLCVVLPPGEQLGKWALCDTCFPATTVKTGDHGGGTVQSVLDGNGNVNAA
jgi:hypothetical protein